MRKQEKPSEKGKQRPKRRTDGKNRKDARPEKPPESAEDFEHVLRRLISARGNRSEHRT